MKRLISLFLFCSLLIVVTFLLFDELETSVEVNLKSTGSLFTYTLLSFAFLTSDIILPVPSSFAMILNGKILGVFSGTILSLVSGVLSSSIGFYLGRKANPWFDKLFSEKDKEISNRLFHRFGNTAIIISKALPVMSEAISFVSGTTAVAFKTFLYYSVVGHFIVSLIYACAGSLSFSFNSNFIAAVIIASALLVGWVVQRVMR